jgi:hypothetical protein
MPPKPDSHIYHGVGFTPDSTRLFLNALRYYADRLDSDLKAITIDTELAKLLDDKSLKSFRITKEIEEVRGYADRFEEKLPLAESMGDYTIPISHGLVRRLKSICVLYLADMDRRRNNVAATHGMTILGLEALDTKLTQWREKMEMGVFRDADPIPLQVGDLASVPVKTISSGARHEIPGVGLPAAAAAAVPKIATTIEILDPQLRERCLDLFTYFDESNQTHRFDNVVSEATRILEDRVRTLAVLGPDVSGVDLMTKAFAPKAVILRLSSQDSEQEAAHLLFRGAFGFIRNPAHHRILDKLEKERVLQVLGFVDYLLYLAHSATKV